MDKSEVQERKIRVVFLPPRGSTPAPAAQAETPRKQSNAGVVSTFVFPLRVSPSNIVVTLRNQLESTPDVSAPAYSSPSDFIAAAESKAGEERDESGLQPAAGIAASSVAKNTEPTYDELKQQLAQAEKLIAQLKQDQGGLRQRKPGAADDGKSGPKPADLAQQVRAGTEGVPVQITAILCLLSFLLAYLFF